MALKVKANEKLQKIGTHAGKYRYVMQPELYTALSQDKVIKEAALRSGVSQGVMKDELKNAAIQITCYDRNGKEVKRVTSTDPGNIEDPEAENQNGGTSGSGNGNGGGNSGNDDDDIITD